MKNRSKEGVV